MGYTWTDGELITATKLNNTGGGGYDAVIRLTHSNDSGADIITNLTPSIVSGTFAGLSDIISDGGVPNILIEYYHPWGMYYAFNGGVITYVSSNNISMVVAGFMPVDEIFTSLGDLLWSSNDSIAWA